MFKKLINKCSCGGHYYHNKKTKLFACNKCGQPKVRIVEIDYAKGRHRMAISQMMLQEKIDNSRALKQPDFLVKFGASPKAAKCQDDLRHYCHNSGIKAFGEQTSDKKCAECPAFKVEYKKKFFPREGRDREGRFDE